MVDENPKRRVYDFLLLMELRFARGRSVETIEIQTYDKNLLVERTLFLQILVKILKTVAQKSNQRVLHRKPAQLKKIDHIAFIANSLFHCMVKYLGCVHTYPAYPPSIPDASEIFWKRSPEWKFF